MNKPKKFKEKPKEVEAIQFTGDNLNEVREFCNCVQVEDGKTVFKDSSSTFEIPTAFWVVKSSGGAFGIFTDKFPLLYEEEKEDA